MIPIINTISETGKIKNRYKTLPTSLKAISCGIQKSSRANADCQIAKVAMCEIKIHHVANTQNQCSRVNVGRRQAGNQKAIPSANIEA